MTAALARVLVVDDDDVDREKFRRLADRGGLTLEITEAASGAAALRLIAEQHFDVIVVDHRLGDTSGIELVRSIRHYEQRPLPIIMITGLGDERIAVSAIREGVYEYLTKANLTTAEIVQTVSSALRSVGLERGLAEANAARELAEHRLTQSRQQFDNARELALLGSIDIDVESGKQSWSDEIYRLLGDEPSSFVPSRELFLGRVHPDDRAGIEEVTADFCVKAQAFRREFRLVWLDATVRHVLAHGRVTHGPPGAPHKLVVLLQDVTAFRGRRQAETQLRTSEQRFRNLVNGAPIGIFENDASGACTFVNETWTQITGWSAQDAAVANGIACIHPEDRAKANAERAQAVLEQRASVSEFRFLTPEGRSIWVVCEVRPTTDELGVLTGYLGTIMDITERKLQQSSLIAAKEAAEQAVRTRSDFLAKMSHEIRTPMNSVIGMTALTLRGALGAEQREFLEMASSAANSLLRLIDDILDFSRAEAEGLSLERLPFDLGQCVSAVLRGLQHSAGAKGLELRLALSEAVPQFVIGDAHRLTQVLSNLISNAIKFTDAGAIVVCLDADASVEHHCRLHFAVADTGIGVPEDKQAMIFEAFRQADESVSRRFGGTGLGLTICSQIIKLMKGQLWLVSEEGQGSTFQFSIELPVAQGQGHSAGLLPVRQPVPRAVELLHPAGAPQRILVAEDNQMNRRLIQALLVSAGHHVTMVDDGRAALEQLAGDDFDLVLMDVQMPGMSGIEAVQQLRAREAGGTRRVPVVALTAQAMSGDAERCHAAGMDGYIAKPFDLVQLEGVMVGMPTLGKIVPPPAPESDVPYDRSVLERRVGRDPSLFVELCRLFECRAEVLLAELQRSIDARESAALRCAAHELKGMLLNLSARGATRTVRALEAAGQTARYAEASACLARLVDEVARLLSALRAELPSPLPAALPATGAGLRTSIDSTLGERATFRSHLREANDK